jgi:hypothetical protein
MQKARLEAGFVQLSYVLGGRLAPTNPKASRHNIEELRLVVNQKEHTEDCRIDSQGEGDVTILEQRYTGDQEGIVSR